MNPMTASSSNKFQQSHADSSFLRPDRKPVLGIPGMSSGVTLKFFFQTIQVRNSRWPPPRSLQTPVSKSHLHSARVEPPCLESMHFLAAGLSHVCLPKASGQLTCNSPNDTGQSNVLLPWTLSSQYRFGPQRSAWSVQ